MNSVAHTLIRVNPPKVCAEANGLVDNDCPNKIIQQEILSKYGFWTVNGSTTFGTMPGGVIPGIPDPKPIKLQTGDKLWGEVHINYRHGHWLKKNKETAASMVYKKLGQTGSVYSTEETDKSKVSLTVAPSALLILRYIPQFDFFSVNSLYFKDDTLDGDYLGRYVSGRPYVIGPQPTPLFVDPRAPIPAPAAQIILPGAQNTGALPHTMPVPVAGNAPVVTYKKKRTF